MPIPVDKFQKLMTRSLFARVLCCCLLLIACTPNSQQVNNLAQDKFIQAYFNHRETLGQTYVDPYRQIEHSGDNLEKIIIEEIATAKFSIDLAVQELNLPLVAKALADKHRAGIKVRVILDSNYSHSLSKLTVNEIRNLNQRDLRKYQEFFQLVDLNQDQQLSNSEIAQRDALTILHQAGIKIIDDTADGSKGSGLMHHKFMVIDQKTIVTGSANFTISGIHGDLNNLASKGNVNHLLRINNQQVASLFTQEFNYMWGDAQGGIEPQFGLAKPWRSPKTITWEDTAITIQFAPISQQKNWSFSTNGLIGKTISEATESVDLALFVFSEQELANILQSKSNSGIAIKGVFDSGFAYRYYSEVLDMLGVSLLFRCQVETNNNPWVNPLATIGTSKLNVQDKLHHKFTIIDQKIVISGSQNWSQAANHKNDEVVIIIKNNQVAKHFTQEFERLYQSALLGLPFKLKNQLQQQHSECN